MSVIFQLPDKIQAANLLWDDKSWICEEMFSGHRCLFSLYSNTNLLSIFNWKMYGEKLQDISNYFPFFKDVKVGINAEIDVVLVPPFKENKTYLNILFSNGPLGAEKIQINRGKPKLVLVDVLSYKNIDLREMAWGARRVYLEALFNDIKPLFDGIGAEVVLSHTITDAKRSFFDWIGQNNGKGIVFKNKNAHYVGGLNRDFLEVCNSKWNMENVSLKNVWSGPAKETSEFNFDEYLAIKVLEKDLDQAIL